MFKPSYRISDKENNLIATMQFEQVTLLPKVFISVGPTKDEGSYYHVNMYYRDFKALCQMLLENQKDISRIVEHMDTLYADPWYKE